MIGISEQAPQNGLAALRGVREASTADKNGERLLGVEVVALRRNHFRGHVTLTPDHGSRASTNDLGQFRLFNLPPGEYFVVAAPAHSPRDLGTTRRSGLVTTYYPGTRAAG